MILTSPIKIDKVIKNHIISDMTTSEAMRAAIAHKAPGSVFSSGDFLSLGSRAAVDQALTRMMKAGLVSRVARGLYAVAGQRVDAQTIARAMAHKTGEHLGLAPSAVSPASSHALVVPTSGVSRTVQAAGRTLQFRRMSPRKVRLASSAKGKVLLELWSRGFRSLTLPEIQRATAGWTQTDLHAHAPLIPAWLRSALQQAHAQRKSAQVGLSGAYDWSNPLIKDGVLIRKVLSTHNFEDVARLCFYYGVPKVKRIFKGQPLEPLAQASVSRMLGNISKGMRAMKERSHA